MNTPILNCEIGDIVLEYDLRKKPNDRKLGVIIGETSTAQYRVWRVLLFNSHRREFMLRKCATTWKKVC